MRVGGGHALGRWIIESELALRLVLVDPPGEVDFGIQSGRGSGYETLFVQRRTSGDISFDFSMNVAESPKDGRPNFLGPFAQGPPAGRFIYIDVGTYAGQKGTPWARRMKIPLQEITWALVKATRSTEGARLEARIPGRGRDGGPNCATVKLLGTWQIVGHRRTGRRA